jgi:hypothetical protein
MSRKHSFVTLFLLVLMEKTMARGRKPRVPKTEENIPEVSYVANGQLVTERVDFDSYAAQKAQENEEKQEMIKGSKWTDWYISLGGTVLDAGTDREIVLFAKDEFDLIVFKSGDIKIADGVNEIIVYSASDDQFGGALRLIGIEQVKPKL